MRANAKDGGYAGEDALTTQACICWVRSKRFSITKLERSPSVDGGWWYIDDGTMHRMKICRKGAEGDRCGERRQEFQARVACERARLLGVRECNAARGMYVVESRDAGEG